MQLRDVPTFARVRVTDFGSVDEVKRFAAILDDVVVVWTRCESAANPLAIVDVRGVLSGTQGLVRIPDDAEVTVVEGPRYAGQPEDLVKEAQPADPPAGSLSGPMMTPEGWPPLIWESDIVFSPCQGLTDPELAVEVLLCALSVAPDSDPNLRRMLLAALRARYAKVTRDPRTYQPARYPWRGRDEPDESMLKYLLG